MIYLIVAAAAVFVGWCRFRQLRDRDRIQELESEVQHLRAESNRENARAEESQKVTEEMAESIESLWERIRAQDAQIIAFRRLLSDVRAAVGEDPEYVRAAE